MVITNEIVDQRLENRSIKRIDDYIKAIIKIHFLCTTCGYVFLSTAQRIFGGGGCPQCANHVKMTNVIIDQKIEKRNIKRISDCIDSKTKMMFGCLMCDHTWENTYNHILSGQGCPQCAGVVQLTNNDVDNRLVGRNIKRLEDYKGSKTKINFQCLNCNHIWNCYPNSLFSGHGCPNCAGNIQLTNDIIDNRLLPRNIIRIDEYISNNIKITFKCNICEHIWKAKPSNVVNGNKTGCPKCAGNARLTNEIVDERIANRPIKRIGQYAGNNTKIDFQCLVCENIWAATPAHIFDGRGCPLCHNTYEEAIYDILSKNNIYFLFHHNIKDIILQSDKRMFVDFYIPNINTIIEYNGRQHYEPVCFGGMPFDEANKIWLTYQLPRDAFVKEFCHNNDISLIVIDGRHYQYDKLEKYFIDQVIVDLK